MAIIAVPLTLALNALEFVFFAKLVGQTTSFGRAVEVTVIGSAANLLPVPGAALVRLAAVKSGGAKLGSGLSVTALLAMLSLGLNLAYSGGWAAFLHGRPISWLLLAIGTAIILATWLVAGRVFKNTPVVVGLVGVRIGLIALDAARTWLSFLSIGYVASFGQASVLTMSTALAAIVAIIPAGLGLREGIAAFMAPFVGLQAAAAFLATSLSRVVGLSVVMGLTLVLALRRKTPSTS